jgi:tRNA pseudouridine38-40 synthase
MKRYKCMITYDGTFFAGYQVQPEKRTVQSELEKALRKMHKGEEVKVTASGRTDAGVHAKAQVIHFDSPYTFPVANWEKGLNALLPDDIVVVKTQVVESGFHARFDTVGKEYRYIVSRSIKKDPFQRNYSYHYPYPLDLAAMLQASSLLIGTHDFTSFCNVDTGVKDKIRTIYHIEIQEENEFLVFRFTGNGFLYNMVRILVGTLLEIGSGKRNSKEIPMILSGKSRNLAGKTAPAHGLYLWDVFYK